MRATALQNIAQEMNLEEFGPTDVKNKIKNLRATYYLELDKIKSPLNQALVEMSILQK
nr:unnamed protein product [Callosobruchus analis]